MFTLYYYLFIFIHHLFLLLPPISAKSPPYTPTDCILLNCGTPSNVTLPDGREWNTDSPYTLNTQTTTISTASHIDPSIDKILYSTARIFQSRFTYTFHVSSPGQKFLRLYFYPTDYLPDFDKTRSFFSVDAANHTLLSNFSAFLNLGGNLSTTLAKEYIVTVNENNLLELTFTPAPNSYAFINCIELVSIPEKFYVKGHDNDDDLELFSTGGTEFYYIDDYFALETVCRLNVGGFDISPTQDSGMFRSWSEDDEYLYDHHFVLMSNNSIPVNYTSKTPAYTAPDIVYTTFRTTDYSGHGPPHNLTWKFKVDSDFYYLLRLYFCEIDDAITKIDEHVFFIFINNLTVEKTADVIEWSGSYGTPVYRDYVVFCSERDLWLAMRPNNQTQPIYLNVILNGLEIFKLGPSGDSLAAPNPEVPVAPLQEPKQVLPPHKNGGVSSTLIGGVAGGAVGGVILIGALLLILWRRRGGLSRESSMSYAKSRSTNTNASSLPSVRSRRFSLEEIKTATSNFDDTFIIGIGGFGNVYKGYIEKGTITVAIKRLNPSSRQGAREFRTEIEMLSHLRHLHLVSLIGYCDDNGEMILVYDYMAHGTLRSHLYRGDNPSLSWKQRLHICIGAAKGLHYLHADAEPVIIHRDIKSTNILLDDKMVAKVSDFGLSKMGPSDTVGHVSTNVKGSFGYLDPEYFRRQQLTTKSDVYSFGVVLFEVLCARQVLKPELPKEEVNLAEWARNCYKKDRLGEIVDQNLKGEIAEESLKIYGELGFNCLKDQGIDRPTMGDVVWSLEFALQLQESNENLGNKVVVDSDYQMIHIDSDDESSFIGAKDKNDHSFSSESVGKSKGSGTSITTSSSDGFKSGSVFSEILNPNAR